jgi:hypothetical protein
MMAHRQARAPLMARAEGGGSARGRIAAARADARYLQLHHAPG